LEARGWRGEEEGWGKKGVMNKTLYAHMIKRNKKKCKKQLRLGIKN
jgi:hypothetical protein